MNIKPRRCEITELFEDECAHCRPVVIENTDNNLAWELFESPDLDPGASVPSRWFLAKYAGRCFRCGERFRVDDMIARHVINGDNVYSGQDCCGH